MSDSFLSQFRSNLTAPVFADEEKTRMAAMLTMILWAALPLILFGGATLLFTLSVFGFALPLMGAFLFIILINLLLTRRGYVYEAVTFLSVTTWIMMAASAYYYGGVRSVSYSALIIPILIAGLLLGGRGGFFFAFISILAGAGFIIAETRGSLTPVAIPSISAWLSLTMIFLLAAALLSLTSASINNALELARQEIKEREQVENALRRAKETAESANRAKSEYVSIVSHELKSPLTAVVGYTELLKEGLGGPMTDEQLELLKMVEIGGDLLVSLLSDLTDMSRIESGNLPLQIEEVDALKIIEKAALMAKSQIERKEQKMVLKLPPDLPLVYADPSRLTQILTNLINNAHKYTLAEGTIEIEANKVGEEMALIAVRDNGIGIEEDEQPLVFQQFYRSIDDEARREPGTGLGLSIARQLVELQGGEIWFESVFREGTTFYFTLPVCEG